MTVSSSRMYILQTYIQHNLHFWEEMQNTVNENKIFLPNNDVFGCPKTLSVGLLGADRAKAARTLWRRQKSGSFGWCSPQSGGRGSRLDHNFGKKNYHFLTLLSFDLDACKTHKKTFCFVCSASIYEFSKIGCQADFL